MCCPRRTGCSGEAPAESQASGLPGIDAVRSACVKHDGAGPHLSEVRDYGAAMPSYRVELQIADVRPGHHPASVVPIAAGAAGEEAHVDKPQLIVQDGLPWAVIRFSIDRTGRPDEDRRACDIAAHVERTVTKVADVSRTRLTRRVHGEWVIVPG